MYGKRKRSNNGGGADKRLKVSGDCTSDASPIHQPLLFLYYPHVLTLRQYLLSQLSPKSKAYRRRIAALTYRPSKSSQAGPNPRPVALSSTLNACLRDDENNYKLAHLLDTTVVGSFNLICKETSASRSKDFATFSQKISSSVDTALDYELSPQSEVSSKIILYALA